MLVSQSSRAQSEFKTVKFGKGEESSTRHDGSEIRDIDDSP